jgi:transcriptional regulator with XRE-family HTH domain
MSILQMPSTKTTDLAEFLGNSFRERREARGLSISQLAKRAGFHPSILKLIERGVWIPNYDEVRAIAEAMDCGWNHLSFFASLAEAQVEPRFNKRRGL